MLVGTIFFSINIHLLYFINGRLSKMYCKQAVVTTSKGHQTDIKIYGHTKSLKIQSNLNC